MSEAQVTVSPVCDLCGSEEAVQWFCEDCQEVLCDRCKISHQGGRKTRNDQIVPITLIKNHTSRKTVPILCKEHRTKICDLYCQKCEKLICVQCLVRNHEAHDIQSIEALFDFKTSELSDFEKHLHTKLSLYESLLKDERKQHEDCKSFVDKLTVSVKDETENLIRKFTNSRDKQLFNLSAYMSKEVERFTNIRKECDFNINNIRKSIEDARKAKETGNACQIITVVEDIKQKISCLKDPTVSVQQPLPELQCVCHHESVFKLFLPDTSVVPEQKQVEVSESDEQLGLNQTASALSLSQINIPVVEVVGKQKQTNVTQAEAVVVPTPSAIDIDNVENALKSQIQGKKGFICVICPTDNNRAWIAVFNDKHLTLVNTEGNVLRTSVDLGGKILDAVSDGDVVFITTYQGHCVKRLSKTGDSITTFSNLSSFYTRGLCLCSDKNIMVCVSSTNKYPDNNCRIVRLDRDGGIIQEIQYSNQKQLFISPLFVASLHTGDLMVLDNIARGRYRVICLDTSGKHKYTWEGETGGYKMERFSPERMACSSNESVYITDNCNNCVYILGKNGEAKRYALDKKYGILNPVAITWDIKGRLWLGCKDAKLYILQ